MCSKRAGIVQELQGEILRLEGFKSSSVAPMNLGLGPMLKAFPKHTFPLGSVHEFISTTEEDESASIAFITGMLSSLMGGCGTTMWISSNRRVFPPALGNFGVQPDRVIFVDLKNEKDILPAMEEALKCAALTAVVGEVQDLSFIASRRLQLAVEESRVTGFVLRRICGKINTTACVSRWRVKPLPSESLENLPGIGFPLWKIELLRIRNGRPGVWTAIWKNGKFEDIICHGPDHEQVMVISDQETYTVKRKIG